MKKITKYLLMLVCLITLSGCGKSATIKEPRTIVLNIDSEVTPEFSSNFGSGSYDEETKKYTHTIDYIKDLYIFLSYEDLKTVTVHIPTSDMNKKTITKTVEFGQILDAEVEITVEGVKTLEGLQIENNINYSNLKVGKKNTFKFTLPSREQDYNIEFTLPGYRDFNIQIKEEDLVSGNAKVSTIALLTEQIYIGFDGSQYEYEIYSSNTNQLVSSGNNYSYESSISYVVLPNTESYYVKIVSSNRRVRLYKVNINENIVFDAGGNNLMNNGYLNVESDDNYYETRLYNKDTKIISNDRSIYGAVDSYGLLVRNSEDYKWYYLEDLKSHIETNIDDSWNKTYHVDFSEMVEVTFDITKIHYLTKEVISSNNEKSLYINYDVFATYSNNVFKLTIEEINSGSAFIDLYDKNNQKVVTIEYYIGSDFTGSIFSGTVEYEGRTIPYTFPVFVEDLVYSDGKYSYPSQVINTDLSLLMVRYIDKNGWVQSLSINNYLLDENQEVIMGTDVGYQTYFELQVGKSYTFTISGIRYSFTVTETDMDAGYVFIVSDSIKKTQVKVPANHYLIASEYNQMKFFPDSNGIVTIPVGEKTSFYVTISNGIVEGSSTNIITNDDSIYEFYPFYVLDGATIQNGENYSSNMMKGDNGISYYYIYDVASQITELNTPVEKVYTNGRYEEYKISLENFVYNDEYNAYYCNFEEQFDHILNFNSDYAMQMVSWSKDYYKTSYYDFLNGKWVYKAYVENGTKIEIENNPNDFVGYTFTNSDEKELNVTVEYNGIAHEITIENSNNN